MQVNPHENPQCVICRRTAATTPTPTSRNRYFQFRFMKTDEPPTPIGIMTVTTPLVLELVSCATSYLNRNRVKRLLAARVFSFGELRQRSVNSGGGFEDPSVTTVGDSYGKEGSSVEIENQRKEFSGDNGVARSETVESKRIMEEDLNYMVQLLIRQSAPVRLIGWVSSCTLLKENRVGYWVSCSLHLVKDDAGDGGVKDAAEDGNPEWDSEVCVGEVDRCDSGLGWVTGGSVTVVRRGEDGIWVVQREL